MDYLPYVQAHRDFYRPLEEADDIGTVYRASVVPDDWRRNQSGIWAMHRPPGAPNEAAARKLMEALARATSGEEGPYILGDRRWRESRVVSYRYGAAPHLDDPYSARVIGRTIDKALRELYNPAQRDVIRRTRHLLRTPPQNDQV